MLEMIVERQVIYVLTGGVVVLGILGKCISNGALKRLVRAAENISKSNHALMRLVRAKFEHACMVSEKVENVGVFVDKYLHEYKVFGVKLHSWRRMEKVSVITCLLLGVLGAVLEYLVHGMNDMVVRAGAYGGILGILLYLFHLTSDETYQFEMTRNYIVDYLENVCLHRYEKQNQKEEAIRPVPVQEAPTEIIPPAAPEHYEEPRPAEPLKAVESEKKEEKKEEKKVDKDVLIRQILEEFMA